MQTPLVPTGGSKIPMPAMTNKTKMKKSMQITVS